MNELVSVIVPIYNSEKFLKKCIESILSQTYENLEIILINDGSTDRSADISEYYAGMDDRIRYIFQENKGQSISRNTGIEMSNGRYIYFMDSDDYIDKGYLEYAINYMRNNKADLFISNYYHELESGEAWKERDFQEGIFDLTGEKDRYKFLVNVFLPYKCGFEVWNRLYDAEIVKNNNLKFPVFKPVVAEDLYFNLLYSLFADRVIITNGRFYHYLHNDNSTMAKNSGVHINRYNEVSRLYYDFLKKNNNFLYLKANYAFIHLLLIYHELMNDSLKGMKERIGQVEDKESFRKLISLKLRDVVHAAKNMGYARAAKYSLLGVLYRIYLQES